jgi:phosphoglycolate phosphatase
MIRAVAFDLDGTLIDTVPDLHAAANTMLRQIGRSEIEIDELSGFVGNGLADLVARTLSATALTDAPLSPALRAGAEAAFRTHYRQALFARSRIYPGVFDCLQSLKTRHLPAVCVTNKESQFAVPLLDAAGLTSLLVGCYCADLAGDRKPSPNLLLCACGQLGVEPGQLLYIGDSAVDVIAARGAGCSIAMVTYGYRRGVLPHELQPDFRLASLGELPPRLGSMAYTAATA